MAQDVPVEMIDEIVAAEALGELRSNSVMAGLVNRNFENAVAQRGDTINVTFRAALSLGTNQEIYSVLVDVEGRVLATEAGEFSEPKLERMLSALE